MRVCTHHNLTVSLQIIPRNEFYYFDLEKRKFLGNLAKPFLENFFLLKSGEYGEFLRTQEDLFRNCKFIRADEEGELLENGTYSGSIGHVVAKRSDFAIRPHNMFINNSLVDLSNVISSQNIVIGHFIKEPKDHRFFLINFQMLYDLFVPSPWFLAECVGLLAFSFLFLFLISLIHSKANLSRSFAVQFFFNLFSLSDSFFKQPTFIGLFFLCNLTFLSLMAQIFSSNVKTERTLVDSSSLLYSKYRLYHTKREACWLFRSKDIEVFVKAPKGTFHHYLYYKKTNLRNPCFLMDYLLESRELKRHFFFVSASMMMPILRQFNVWYNSDIFQSEPFETENLVYYLSKKIDTNAKQSINYYANIQLHAGYTIKFDRDYLHSLDTYHVKIKQTFYSVRDYIDFYTVIESVRFEAFTFVLVFYLLWFSLLIVRLLHYGASSRLSKLLFRL